MKIMIKNIIKKQMKILATNKQAIAEDATVAYATFLKTFIVRKIADLPLLLHNHFYSILTNKEYNVK